MNLWLFFWTVMLVVAGASVAAIALVVTVEGLRDPLARVASPSRQNADR